jgi:hypothetical protein
MSRLGLETGHADLIRAAAGVLLARMLLCFVV